MTTSDRILDLYARRRQAQQSGSDRAAQRQLLAGKLTARQRIDLLVDKGSFFEFDDFALGPPIEEKDAAYGDGVIAGTARVHGRQLCLFAQDATVLGGSLGLTHGRKILKAMELAERIGCPIVAMNDSAGARIQEGVDALAAYADIGLAMIRLSGILPQISLNLGSCAGGAAYGAVLADFVVMVDGLSHMFVTGPEVIEAALGQRVTREELGGARLCCEQSGTAHYLAEDEPDAIDWVRTLLAYLPNNNNEGPPEYTRTASPRVTDADRSLDQLVPTSPSDAYDMDVLVKTLLDDGDFLEVGELFGRALMVGFGLIDGGAVGMVASRPSHGGGALDGDACDKAARFVRFCDAMDIPLVTLADLPGFMPGIEQERAAILTRGAKLLYAYGEATVPMVTVIVRKAYGGGYAVLGSKHLGADINLAWPTAEIATMGPDAAVQVLHRRELAEATDLGELAMRTSELAESYRAKLGTPYAAAARGYVDRVIAPHETRLTVSAALRMLRSKRVDRPTKKHGNIPL